MIRTLLFDLDGTILDTNELIIETFLHVMEGKLDQPITREAIIDFMGTPLADQFRHFTGLEQVDEFIEAYRDYNLRRHDELVTAFPHVVEVIAELHGRGIRMGIVTTKLRRTTMMGLKLCGLDTFFDAIVTFEDVEHPKPHPEPVLRAMELLKADPASTMMVGDSPVDIESANRAGVISIGVSWSLKGEEYIRQFNPAHIIHDMRDLLELAGLKGSVR